MILFTIIKIMTLYDYEIIFCKGHMKGGTCEIHQTLFPLRSQTEDGDLRKSKQNIFKENSML